jgi:hypothetical protein
MRSILKNKKGAEIPVMILVIGVFAVCGLAIMSFSISRGNTEDILGQVALIEKANFEIQKYDFYLRDEINLFEERDYDQIKNYFPIFFDEDKNQYYFLKNLFSFRNYVKE